MQIPKQGFEESLLQHVVLTGKCTGCAACVLVCPYDCLSYDKRQPRLVKKCEDCGICPKICPKHEWLLSKAEEFVFGRRRTETEDFGVYRHLLLAQAVDQKTLRKCQDGGVVTTLLSNALKNGKIDGAALSGVNAEKPLFPMPKFVTAAEEVLESAGTRYSYSPNLLALREGLKQRKKNLAFVGTPCQVHAIRSIQMFPLRKYSKALQFTVGLMCTESFSYEGFIERHLKEKMGINLTDVEKINIKGKILVSLKSGLEKSVALSEAKQYTSNGCRRCVDFSAELADISVGGLGLSGWTFVVLRTEKGKMFFEDAVEAGMLRTRNVEKESVALSLLHRLSRKKRRNIRVN